MTESYPFLDMRAREAELPETEYRVVNKDCFRPIARSQAASILLIGPPALDPNP